MRTRYLLPIVLCSLLLAGVSCRRQVEPGGEAVVARLGDQVLLRDEIEPLTLNAPTPEDSARIAEAYIRQWAEDALFLEKAKKALTPELEQMVEDYRKSLTLHAYAEYLVRTKMDKTVSEDTLLQFYEANQRQFLLKENILKGIFLILPNDAPQQAKLRQWLQKPQQHIEQIEKYAYDYATGYQLFTDQWISDNQILLRIPYERNELNGQLSKGSLIEKTDSLHHYMLQVVDKHMAGELMPYDYARSEIERMVLERRQVEFIRQQKADLYDDAINRLRLLLE